MQVVVVKKENLYRYPFPNEFIQSYWIKDLDEYGNERNLISIEQLNNNWILVGNDNCKIIDNNKEVLSVAVSLNKFYKLKITTKDSTTDALIYVCNENDATYTSYILEDGEYTIGSSATQNIILNNNDVSEEHAVYSPSSNIYEV